MSSWIHESVAPSPLNSLWGNLRLGAQAPTRVHSPAQYRYFPRLSLTHVLCLLRPTVPVTCTVHITPGLHLYRHSHSHGEDSGDRNGPPCSPNQANSRDPQGTPQTLHRACLLVWHVWAAGTTHLSLPESVIPPPCPAFDDPWLDWHQVSLKGFWPVWTPRAGRQ